MKLILNKGKEALGKVVSFSRSLDLLLRKTDIFELEKKPKHILIRCLDGSLWITLKGDEQDYLLQKGQVFEAERPQGVLVQGWPNGLANIIIS